MFVGPRRCHRLKLAPRVRTTRRAVVSVAVALYAGTLGWSGVHAEPQAPAAAPTAPVRASAEPDNGALLKQYCVTCHSERAKTGGLSLEGVDPANVAAHGELLEKIVRKVRVGHDAARRHAAARRRDHPQVRGRRWNRCSIAPPRRSPTPAGPWCTG